MADRDLRYRVMVDASSARAAAATVKSALQSELSNVRLDAGSGGMGSLGGQITGLGGAFARQLPVVGQFAGSLGSLATGAGVATAAGLALREAWDLGDVAASAERSAKYFEAFSGSAAKATENLSAMEQATGRAVSRQEAMSVAAQYLGMGIARNSQELEQLAHMAIMLGGNTRTASEALQEFSLLLANESILRLDTFNISGARVRQRIEELQDSMEGLSRSDAFRMAVLEEGTKKVKALEAAGVEAGRSADRLASAWADLRVELGKPIVGVVKIVREGAAGVVEGMVNDLRTPPEKMAADQARTTTARYANELAAAQAGYNAALAAGEPLLAAQYEAQVRAAEANLQQAQAVQKAAEVALYNRNIVEGETGAMLARNAATFHAEQAMWGLKAAIDAVGYSAEIYSPAIAGFVAGVTQEVNRVNKKSGRDWELALREQSFEGSYQDYYSSFLPAGSERGWAQLAEQDLLNKQQEGIAEWRAGIKEGERDQERATEKAKRDWERAVEEMANAFESALRSVPGLFGTSQVTDEDMEMAKMGLYQPKADEYLRRLKDEVYNGTDYADVDIREAARRAGLPEGADPKGLYMRLEQMWNSGELFANAANIPYFMDPAVVQGWLAQQQAGQAGQQNLLNFFGMGGKGPQQFAMTGKNGLPGMALPMGQQGVGDVTLPGAGAQLLQGIQDELSGEEARKMFDTISQTLVSGIAAGWETNIAATPWAAMLQAGILADMIKYFEGQK